MCFKKTMNITPINNSPAFKGYDARKLKAIAMTTNQDGIAQEMKTICNKYGVDVWLAAPEALISDKFEQAIQRCPYTLPWAQDILNVTSKKEILYPWSHDGLGWLLEMYKSFRGHFVHDHTKGGNFYIVNNGHFDDIFVGSNEITKERKTCKYFTDTFGVKNVHIISQPDYHIDLGIRPLNNKNVLVCDDSLMTAKIREGMRLISEKLKENPSNSEELRNVLHNLGCMLDDFLVTMRKNPYASADSIANQISQAGFNPIRVPARFYYTAPKDGGKTGLRYDLNFANALVFEKNNKELVYVTNKSPMDELMNITPEIERQIGFSFEKIFKDSISPYVKKEDIYFVSDKNGVMNNFLSNMDAGIHCLCAEIPL